MPHVVVKLWPGKSERQKARLADQIVKDITAVLDYGEESVSVAIEEVRTEDWTEEVFKPDIQDRWDKLYKKPGTPHPTMSSSSSSIRCRARLKELSGEEPEAEQIAAATQVMGRRFS
jgi:4-oxalocrotonate tautomerase